MASDHRRWPLSLQRSLLWVSWVCRRMASRFADAGYLGPFGLDAIATDDAIVLLECNPRYTAGIELIERRLRFSALAAVCGGVGEPVATDAGVLRRHVVLSDGERVTIPNPIPRLTHNGVDYGPAWCDLPTTDEPIPAGQPVCTRYELVGEPS